MVAGRLPRRETARNAAAMVSGLLMELEDHNCWTMAEALGYVGPHGLQHLLSRAIWDDQVVVMTLIAADADVQASSLEHARRLALLLQPRIETGAGLRAGGC